ncbi:MgPP2CL-1 [Candida margitis]|uniref:MgPP2CL-1 n=1 Tax=Candida margitis TaxID=1775924 RepID=UPI002228000A|nr:MgPP2CL-1 [Candida margitis]KAI5968313.1 MgPP2CL-1 [Candida margitis]
MSATEADGVANALSPAVTPLPQQGGSHQRLAQRRAEHHQQQHTEKGSNQLPSNSLSQPTSNMSTTPPLSDPKISLPPEESKNKFDAIDSPPIHPSAKARSKTSSEYDPFSGLSFKVGVAENKNSTYRSKMEDVHTYIANFAERVDWGYFAIFDGHAGKESARWCGNNLHSLLEQEIDLELQDQNNALQATSNSEAIAGDSKSAPDVSNRSVGNSNTSNSTGSASSIPLKGRVDMKDHLYKSFVKADEMIEKNGQGASGCTAAVAVLRWESETEDDCMVDATNTGKQNSNDAKTFDFVPTKNHKRMLYTSNVGDSRIILSRNGKAYRLSYDHKASDKNEIDRVENSGGLILKNRVNGVLAVTRSLGDSYMKDLVLGKPFTTSTQIIRDDEFMIIACDGVWDVISDTKACKIIAECFKNGLDAQEASKKLCQLAIDASTTDNVTVMVVQFDQSVFDQ